MRYVTSLLIACTIIEALQSIRPKSQWNLRGDTYAGLEWLDQTQIKPTEKEINSAIATCQSQPVTKTLEQRITDLETKVNTLGVTK